MGSDHVNFLEHLFSNIRGFSPPPSFLPLKELVMETLLPRLVIILHIHSKARGAPLPSRRPLPSPAQSERCCPAEGPGPLPAWFQVPEPVKPVLPTKKGESAVSLSPLCSSYTRDSHTGTESESWLCIELSPVSESSSLPGQLLASPRAWSTHTSAQA